MDKEVKIGLTIILVLFIAFMAVLVKKTCSSRAVEHTLIVDNENSESFEAATEKDAKSVEKASISKRDIAPASHPTVVAATMISSKPPMDVTSDADQWNTVSDDSPKTAPVEKTSALTPPPSFMPVPGKNLHTFSRVVDAQYKSNLDADENEVDDPVRHSSESTYIVAEGESLYDIARTQLGKAWRWAEIYELNREVLGDDLDCLTPGTKIVLPEGNSPTANSLAQHPSVGYLK